MGRGISQQKDSDLSKIFPLDDIQTKKRLRFMKTQGVDWIKNYSPSRTRITIAIGLLFLAANSCLFGSAERNPLQPARTTVAAPTNIPPTSEIDRLSADVKTLKSQVAELQRQLKQRPGGAKTIVVSQIKPNKRLQNLTGGRADLDSDISALAGAILDLTRKVNEIASKLANQP